jgi:hypothetical protein
VTDGEFWEKAMHTDVNDVPRLDDRTAGQVLLKMAALAVGTHAGTVMSVEFRRGDLCLVTPLGTYTFVCNTSDELVVEQVM